MRGLSGKVIRERKKVEAGEVGNAENSIVVL